MTDFKRSSRRHVLRMGAAVGAGLLVPYRDALALDTPGKLGAPLGPYGERSPFEKAVRWRRESQTPETGSSFTPIQDSVGTLTPSSLHYERHHAGIPTIDPAQHRLVIHGMVDRPLVFTMDGIPLVYNGWVQNLPNFWKNQLTPAQRNPFPPAP